MFNVKFLNMDNLNHDLFDFLVEQSYPPGRIEFIKEHKKILPIEGGRSADKNWRTYYTPDLLSYVKEKERLIFKIFPLFIK